FNLRRFRILMLGLLLTYGNNLIVKKWMPFMASIFCEVYKVIGTYSGPLVAGSSVFTNLYLLSFIFQCLKKAGYFCNGCLLYNIMLLWQLFKCCKSCIIRFGF